MKALIIVDIQNDFCPHGNLAVKEGNLIIPFVNNLILSDTYDLILATQDYHPKDHKSFASVNNKKVGELTQLNGLLQVMWPDHCVEGSSGADFHPSLLIKKVHKIFKKGQNKEVDSYSGFFDNDKKTSTGLGEYLKKKNIHQVHVVGLALDYCVKATALDSASLGFDTTVLLEGTKPVNLHPNDELIAIGELIKAGVKVL